MALIGSHFDVTIVLAAKLQSQSKTLVDADKRSISNPSTQSAHNSRVNGFMKFCASHSIPCFPIVPSIMTLCLHERSLASDSSVLDGFVSGVERARRVSVSLWRGRPMCEDVDTRLMDDVILGAFCRLKRKRKAQEQARPRSGVYSLLQGKRHEQAPTDTLYSSSLVVAHTKLFKKESSSEESVAPPAATRRRIASHSPSPSPELATEDESPRPENDPASDKLSVEDLAQILLSLSPVLAPVRIASALHSRGLDTKSRLGNVVRSISDPNAAISIIKSENLGIQELHRRLLVKKMAELRTRLMV